MLWEAFSPDRFPQHRKEMLMKAMTINTESDNPRRNKYLIPVMLLVVVILIGFLAYSAQQKPEAVVIPTISQSVLEEKYGLQVNLVAVTAAGGLVDVRFKFVDGEKVKALLQEPENFPTLQVAGSPVPLSAPEEGRPAEIQYEDSANLFLMYPNMGNIVKPGTPVTIVFGDIQVEPVVAK
jgi:hypothetical protein